MCVNYLEDGNKTPETFREAMESERNAINWEKSGQEEPDYM